MAGRLKGKDTNTNGQGIKFITCCLLPIACCLLLTSCGTPYGIYHRVENGQTLYSIARTYNVPLKEIVRVNGLKEPVTLREGDAVFIPGASIEKVVEAHADDAYTPPPKTRKKKEATPSPPPRAEITPPKADIKAEKGRFIWPLDGKLISGFGVRNGEKHTGIDIKAEEGAPVKAAESGKVIYSGDGLNGYGNLIIIKHEGPFFSVYAHNRKNMISEGGLVEKGEVIAEVGATGRATTPHLHFEIRKNKTAIDPFFYLPDKGTLVYK